MITHLKPREKLLTLGPGQLSDAELLSIFLRTGTKTENLASLSSRLLNHFGSVSAILHSDYKDLRVFNGVGISKWAQLRAAAELVSRSHLEQLRATDLLDNSQTTKMFLKNTIGYLEHEVFVCLFLDIRHRLLAHKQIFRGSIDETAIYMREILKECLSTNCKNLIIAHNHPGGSLDPSPEDFHLTEILMTTLPIIEVELLDHFIVSKTGAISFIDLGIMPNNESNH